MLVHLYGVVAESSPTPEGLKGRRDGPVRFVADGGLRAVVSDVEDETGVRRADLLDHAHVLEALAADDTVIPAQFGMLFPDDEHVRRDLLQAQHDELGGLLSGFEGLIQLTVQARYREEAALRELLRLDPDLIALRDAARAPGAGQGMQMRLGEAVAQGLERLKAVEADALLERLAPHTRSVAVNEARGANDVLNAAFLVERANRGRLDAAVTLLSEEFGSRMTLRYVGPQPPYSFLEPMRAGELTWG